MGMKKVVIMGMDQRHYYGEVDDVYLTELEWKEPVVLQNVYQLCIIDQQVVSPEGKVCGLSRSYMMMNVGTAEKALKELKIQPAGWYDVEDCGLESNFAQLVAQVEKELKKKPDKGDGPRIVPVGAGALPPPGVPNLADLMKGPKK